MLVGSTLFYRLYSSANISGAVIHTSNFVTRSGDSKQSMQVQREFLLYLLMQGMDGSNKRKICVSDVSTSDVSHLGTKSSNLDGRCFINTVENRI